MAANDRQVGGKHYRKPVQHWDWAQYTDYLVGLASKYLDRHKDKNGIEDIEKSLHCIAKLVERDYPDYRLDFKLTGLVQVEESDQPPREYVNPDL